MSRAFLVRELKRHAPWAGLYLAAGVGILATALFAPEGHVTTELAHGGTIDSELRTYLLQALVWVSLLGGLLAGVTALAPDTARGGTAFLFRMPLSAGAIARTKLAALALYLPGAAVLLAGAALLQSAPTPVLLESGELYPGEGSYLWMLGAIQLGGLACGLVSTVVLGRALPALLLGGILTCGAGFGLLALPFLAFGVDPNGLYAVAVPLFGAAAAGAAWLAFSRGAPHRVTLRPALYAGGFLLPAFAVLVGGAGAAKAWTVSGIEAELELAARSAVASPGGERLAVSLYAQPWCGTEYRVAVVERETGERWVAPCDGAWRPEFSPDGTRLLVRKRLAPGGYVVDLEQRTATEYPGRSRDGFGYRYLAWVDGEPLFVEQRGATLRTWRPRPGDPDDPLREDTEALARDADYALPSPRQLLVAVRGHEAILTDDHGVWAAPLPRRTPEASRDLACQRLETPALRQIVDGDFTWAESAVLSPGGRYLVAIRSQYGDDGMGLEFETRGFAVDLEQGRVTATWDSDLARVDPSGNSFAFGPDDRRFATYDGAFLSVIALEGGAQLAHRPHPWDRRSVATPLLVWSADGERIALTALDSRGGPCRSKVHRLDVEDPATEQSRPVVGFMDDQRVLVADQPLGALELAPTREER